MPITRRLFLIGGGSMIAVAAACGSDSGPGGTNEGPVWSPIPDQSWAIGVPVSFDLRDYCTDADGDTLTFSLVAPLPPGLSLEGSVISGIPTEVTSPAAFTAMADDGRD